MSLNVQAFSGLGELGQAATTTVANLAQATAEVNTATALVKKLTNDVKLGLAPRSDLVSAMDALTEKVNIAQSLSTKGKALSGYLEQTAGGDWPIYLIVLGISMGICYFCCIKTSPKRRKSKK